MKSTFIALLACLIIAFTDVTAQTEPGKTFISGNTSLDLSFINTKLKNDNDKVDFGSNSSIELSPAIGKFVALNFVIGVTLPVSTSTEKTPDDDKYKTSTWAVGPFTRIYFGENDTKFFLSGSAGIGGYSEKFTSSRGSDDEASGGLSMYQVGAGVAIFMNKMVSVDLFLNYTSNTLKSDDLRISNKGINAGLGLSFTI